MTWRKIVQRRTGGVAIGPVVVTSRKALEAQADRTFSFGADVALRLGVNPIAQMKREEAERERKSHLRVV